MDLQGRRRDLGATLKAMANGLGMSAADIVEIERGNAADPRMDRYLAWLTKMETWSAGKREREFLAARKQGRRFSP
jgi:hypothetical protein